MGRAKLMGGPVRTTKGDWNIELTTRHHEHVGRVVYHLIESHERKAEGHELNDRPQSNHGRADTESGKSIFTNRSVDDSPRSKTFEQSLAHFVSALIFRDLLAHQKDIWIARQFFGERFVQCLTISDFPHDFFPLK